MSDSLWPHGLQHARLPCPSPTPGACSNSCPLNRWCHPTISSSVVPFSSCLQSFPASGSFPTSQFFESGSQSIRASASISLQMFLFFFSGIEDSYRVSQMVLVVKNMPANAGDIRDAGLIPGWGRSLGGGSGNPLQYSCLENPMDGEPGGLQSIGMQRVGHCWSDLAHISGN